MWDLKKLTNKFIYKAEINSEAQKTNLWLPKKNWGWRREINQESEINIYILLYIKQINNKDLLYSTGNYIQCLTITYNGEESEKECIHTYTYLQIYIYV